jgi:glycosyltransferase involved in cell wall biosynthesis
MRCEALLVNMPVNCKVTYRGAISHELVNETLTEYDFFVLPTLGENFGHAIFESLSAGIPVLISDQTPWRHLAQQQAGWDLPLVETIWTKTMDDCVAMTDEVYQRWSKQAVEVPNAYVKDNKFEQSYLSLFS